MEQNLENEFLACGWFGKVSSFNKLGWDHAPDLGHCLRGWSSLPSGKNGCKGIFLGQAPPSPLTTYSDEGVKIFSIHLHSHIQRSVLFISWTRAILLSPFLRILHPERISQCHLHCGKRIKFLSVLMLVHGLLG